MSTAFAITPALTEIALDKEGRGEVAFTVTNRRSAPLVACARAVTEAPADAAWFHVAEPERRFAAGETHQVAVRITAPPGAPAGRVRMRLDVASVENPDDDFAEGPWVGVEVPASAPAPPPEKRLPMWLIAAIAAVVLLVGVAIAIAVGGGEETAAPPADPPLGKPPAQQGAPCTSQADCATGERCIVRRCIKVAPR